MRYYDDGLQNVKKMKTIYSLSLRFQILENVRVAKACFVRGLYLLVAVLSATTAAPLVIAMIVVDEVIVVLSAEAFAMGIVIYANIVPFVVLCSIPKFRGDVRRLWNRLSRRRVDCFEMDNAIEGAAKKRTAEEEANAYFVHLQSMWS